MKRASVSDEAPIRVAMIVAITIGTLIRVGVAVISDGTNDAQLWRTIATTISDQGLFDAYRSLRGLNHPPLAALWSRLALEAGGWFPFVIKVPGIVGDALSVALLGKIWLERGDLSRARAAMIAMALSPVAILVSGYHCNTDSLYAFLSLLAMYLLGVRERFFLGGLVLGAAINVKLIPLLLVPVVLSMCRSWRQAGYLVGGLGIGAIPLLPLLFWAAPAVRTNMLGYVPPLSVWGVGAILFNLYEHPRSSETAWLAIRFYQVLGSWAILAATGAISLYAWSRSGWRSGFELAALVYGSFLVLAPGFGHQYLIVVVPVLLAVSIRRSWLFGCLAGAFTLIMYWAYLDSYDLPLRTTFGPGSAPGAMIGFLAWWVLGGTLLQIIKHGRDFGGSEGSPQGARRRGRRARAGHGPGSSRPAP